jgi:hypothetical protein
MTRDHGIIALLVALVISTLVAVINAASRVSEHQSIDIHKCIEAGGKPTRHIEIYDQNYRGHLLCLHPSAVIDAE